MLSKQEAVALVGQAGDGQELLRLVDETRPDMVLTDIKMPKLDGIAAAKIILERYPLTKIIALSMFEEEDLIVEMLEAGAKGYLLKNADKREILDAIFTVNEGNIFYCKHTTAHLASLIVKSKFDSHRKPAGPLFTDREREIIRLICRQHTAQEIGELLFLSKRTVEGYRTRILEKMDVKNTAGVVIFALKHSIIKEEEIL
ncbi:DNA-binding response regulator [Puia dinghuensis]|uniref:DNA-binding response regulator n=2 Tax=Puia dinghuensis TaxID=1792502 RepID=A0A8J2UGH7_9BACT|nr:DNA-binding response regulator [Puia dinghuensis]